MSGPPPRSRRGLAGLLTASAISLTGTRISAIALPWFVLSTTGSALQTGLVAFWQTMPYVVVKALTGPIVDRVGPRVIAVGSNLASTVLVGLVPLLHLLGVLHFGVLLVLVALTGAVRGPGDSALEVLVPDVADEAQIGLERATGLAGTIERLASTVGPALAGAVVALLGPATAIILDAASFLLAGAILAASVPRRHRQHDADEGGYLQQLRTGIDFLRKERLLRTMVGMVSVTNLLDAAMSAVLLPVWARDSGHGPAMIGILASAFGAMAVGGSLTATALAHRLPRRVTYLVGFLLGGAPRFVVLALDGPVWAMLAVYAVGGFGVGFINPIIGAVFYERTPRQMLGRVNALGDSVAWAGIPFGGLLGGALIALVGLGPTLLACGAVYLVATTLPGLQREWRDMDGRREVDGRREDGRPAVAEPIVVSGRDVSGRDVPEPRAPAPEP